MSVCLDPTRPKRISDAVTQEFDLAVIGGGIAGACAARDAAIRGYSVLLLEAVDYASGTSSRSSKFLHGGLRYLEQADIGLVHEALLERAIQLEIAPHICRAQKAFFPVIANRTRPAWQVRIGLALYDLLSYDYKTFRRDSRFPAHETLAPDSKEAVDLRALGLNFSALMTYSDGQTEDTRLVIENIVDASTLGAVCLNHAPLVGAQRENGTWLLDWKDSLSETEHRSRAKYVINAAGPWAESVFSTVFGKQSTDRPLRFSRGVHLLFDVDLPVTALTIATGEPGRVYFVWPHFCPRRKGTLVGTTEREVRENEFDPKPRADEVQELLDHLKRDLPNSGLDESTMFRSFCGTRTLVPSGRKQSGGSTSAVSRREHFEVIDGAVGIYGGKYTTARMTAERAVDIADKHFGRRLLQTGRKELRSRPLPGGAGWTLGKQEELVSKLLLKFGSADSESDRAACRAAAFRLGMRAELLLEQNTNSKKPNKAEYLPAEIRYMTSIEHAATPEDIILRRLLLWEFPGELDLLGRDILAGV